MHQPLHPFSDTLVRRLLEAERVAVLTGAGISAESGVPTFRDPNGLWQRFRPEELANVEAFLANPALVQGWYAHRRAVVEDVEPNDGHRALAALERWVVARGGAFLLATQNVDGLHRRAGSENLVELHGTITRSHCIDCGAPAGADLEAGPPGPLTCERCGGLVRPDVVWFGEALPEDAIGRATEAAALADVYLSVGTSSVVYPAAGLPQIARQSGAYVAEINPEPSDIAWRLSEQVAGLRGRRSCLSWSLPLAAGEWEMGDREMADPENEPDRVSEPPGAYRAVQHYTDLEVWRFGMDVVRNSVYRPHRLTWPRSTRCSGSDVPVAPGCRLHPVEHRGGVGTSDGARGSTSSSFGMLAVLSIEVETQLRIASARRG